MLWSLKYPRSVKGVPRRREQTTLDSAPGVASFGPVQDPCAGTFPWERVSSGEQELCEDILMLAQSFLAFKCVFSWSLDDKYFAISLGQL